MRLGGWFALAALALAACGREPAPPSHPALWQVTAPSGARGYVFGTVHALPAGLAWKTERLDAALAASDRLVLEIVEPGAEAEARAAFARLGTTPGQPELAARIPPELDEELAAALREGGLEGQSFASLEDWAAALTLAFALEAKRGFDPANGADRALVRAAGKRPAVGLETLEGQLAIFDTLPPREQRSLLTAVVAESGDTGADRHLVEAWARGDVAALDREAHDGMLAYPALREALLVGRNRRWADQVAAMLGRGERPFVAVGAAHVAGVDGLPEMLAAKGFTVKRVE